MCVRPSERPNNRTYLRFHFTFRWPANVVEDTGRSIEKISLRRPAIAVLRRNDSDSDSEIAINTLLNQSWNEADKMPLGVYNWLLRFYGATHVVQKGGIAIVRCPSVRLSVCNVEMSSSSSSSSSFIRHNKVRNIKLMKHTVGKTYQAHRALTVAFNWTKLYLNTN